MARGADKAALAASLGADRYVDSTAEDPAKTLAAMGGARVVLATVTDNEAMSAMVGGLCIEGSLLVLGAPHVPLAVSAFALISGSRRVQGWYSGFSIYSEDALAFSVRKGVRSMNEVLPLERVNEGYERMMSGKARFRVVLTTG